jgi:hypothetical protein
MVKEASMNPEKASPIASPVSKKILELLSL